MRGSWKERGEEKKNDIPIISLPRCSPHFDPQHFDLGVLRLHDAVRDHHGVHLGCYVFQGFQNSDGLRECDIKKAGVRGIWNVPVFVPSPGEAL